jgi:hypothetical protein
MLAAPIEMKTPVLWAMNVGFKNGTTTLRNERRANLLGEPALGTDHPCTRKILDMAAVYQ